MALSPKTAPAPHPEGVLERQYIIIDKEQKVQPGRVMLPATLSAYEASNYYVWVRKGRTCNIPEGSTIFVDDYSDRYVSGFVYQPAGAPRVEANCTNGSYLYLDLTTSVNGMGQPVPTTYYGQSIRAILERKK